MAAMAMRRRKRALVKTTNIALPGGRRALAAFQLTPPLGSSMMKGGEEEEKRKKKEKRSVAPGTAPKRQWRNG